MKKSIIVGTLVFLFSCFSILAAQELFFPLQVGNCWTYESGRYKQHITFRLIDQIKSNESTSYNFDDFFSQSNSVFITSDGVKVWELVDDLAYLRWNFSAKPGDSWRYINGSIKLVSTTDTIKTPAGTFTNCCHFYYEFEGFDNSWEEWVAPGIGIVRRTNYFWAVSIYDLVEYHLNSANQLISNSSFETAAGESSIAGWEVNFPHFSPDVPDEGGRWSMELAGGCIVVSCCQTIPAIKNGDICRLSFRGKRLSHYSLAQAELVWPGSKYHSLFLTDTTWQYYSRTDTFSLSAHDTVTLVLSGAGGDVGPGGARFDLVKLEKLGRYSAIPELKNNSPAEAVLLAQNFPNPFNSETIIEYNLPKADRVQITIFNLLGQKVFNRQNAQQPAGHYRFRWSLDLANEPALPGGVYFYQLQTSNMVVTKKMIYLP